MFPVIWLISNYGETKQFEGDIDFVYNMLESFDNNHGRNKSWAIPILNKFHQIFNKTYFDKKPFLRQAVSLS